MPQNLIIRGLSLDDAKIHAKMYRDTGADTKIVQMDGAYAVIVTYPPDWGGFEGVEDIPGPGDGEEDVDDEAVVGYATGTPSDPVETRVPFARYTGQMDGLYWPVITSDPNALVVSQKTVSGALIGREGRRFLANRSNKKRYHVGVDLFCSNGEEVIACADGEVVAFYKFYLTNAGEQSYALLVDHGDFVINYGEVKADSALRYGWQVGTTVTAGQKIARVSTTNMIHFETYRAGTKANARWMQDGSNPPASLRDPTKFLVDLSVSGKRMKPGGVPDQPGTAYAGPLPGSGAWHSRFHGQRWRFDERGVYTDASGGMPLRTAGEPTTCREVYRLFGADILRFAEKHAVNPALIIMTIATETGFARDEGFTGPRTFRWEPGVNNTDVTPNFMGSYSAGPMQTLATSVRDLLRRKKTAFDLAAYDDDVAPPIRPKPVPAPPDHPLYSGATSVELGTAEIRLRWSSTKDDPILVAAAYNTGGIYESGYSPWGIRAYNDHLDRAAAWYGDACAVLSENGII